MKMRIGPLLVVPCLVLALGCSSDDTTGGGTPDTTAPSVSNVAAVDANHVDVTFDEAVKKETAEHRENYLILETTPAFVTGMDAASPGDTTHIATAVLGSDGKTVTVTTQEAMQVLPYDIFVTGVQDLAGNATTGSTPASFTGSNAGDTTPPQVVQRTPAPGMTGVGIAQAVIVQFSEPMNGGSVQAAFQWSWPSGMVSWSMDEEDGNNFVFTPQQPLMYNTTYTVTLMNTAQDFSGNALAATVSWTFRTSATVDNTPPTLVSSVPADGATNVNVATNISLTFSEAINQTESLNDVFLTPDVGNGVLAWSNGGKTATFDPDVDLIDDTSYTMVIVPGSVRDLAGNGNTSAVQIAWSTGATLASGQFSGVVSGDPGTPAANPAGAIVVAADANPFGPGGDDFGIGGSGVVMANGSYSVTHIGDGWYFPLAVLDSNNDGEIDPSLGDAIGSYGVVLGVDMEPDSIQIVGGNSLTGINFSLFDPSVVVGNLAYDGSIVTNAPYYVGVFNVNTFDPGNIPDADFSTAGFWPFETQYKIDEFEDGLAPGTYYVGAYFDANFNDVFDAGIDPVGFYGDLPTPTAITLGAGEDAFNIDILVHDPASSAAKRPVQWNATSAPPQQRQSAARMRRLLEHYR